MWLAKLVQCAPLALLVSLTVLFGLAAAPPAHAQSQCDTASSTCTWAAGTGSWFTGTNWAPSPGLPTLSSTVFVTNGGTANIDISSTTTLNTTIDNGSSIAV